MRYFIPCGILEEIRGLEVVMRCCTPAELLREGGSDFANETGESHFR